MATGCEGDEEENYFFIISLDEKIFQRALQVSMKRSG